MCSLLIAEERKKEGKSVALFKRGQCRFNFVVRSESVHLLSAQTGPVFAENYQLLVQSLTYPHSAILILTQARQSGYEVLPRTSEDSSFAESMSVVSLAVKDGNPVTEATVQQLAAKISTGMNIKNPQDVKDYTAILAAFHDSALSIMEMDDYVPPALLPDLERYPRENISYPAKGSPVRYFDLTTAFFWLIIRRKIFSMLGRVNLRSRTRRRHRIVKACLKEERSS